VAQAIVNQVRDRTNTERSDQASNLVSVLQTKVYRQKNELGYRHGRNDDIGCIHGCEGKIS